MPRIARIAPGGYVYHALNRGVARLALFENDGDFEAFERVLDLAVERVPLRILGYCLMPNHRTVGSGHLYQGRFKAFPIEDDAHYLTVLRYVERNALRAGLCASAEQWRWGSLAHRLAPLLPGRKELLAEGPLPLPRDWVARVNRPQSAKELEALRQSVNRGQPFGSPAWREKTSTRLGLQSTFRHRGRPKKEPVADETKL